LKLKALSYDCKSLVYRVNRIGYTWGIEWGTLGCSTGFCLTIQNGVSSTTGMSRFWEEKSLLISYRERERERENESRTKH